MASDGKVKWIKLKINIFDDEKIRIIRSLPEGDSLVLVWIKFLVLAGKCNAGGYIYFTETMPYTDQILSTITETKLTIIQLALSTFSKFNLIEIDEKGIFINNFATHQDLVDMEKLKSQGAMRTKRYRERLKKGHQWGICSYCDNTAEAYDHVIAVSKGGSEEDHNIVEACKSCNSSKNTKDICEFLNERLSYKTINTEKILNNTKLNNIVLLYKGLFVTRNMNLCDATEKNRTEEEKNKKDIEKQLPF